MKVQRVELRNFRGVATGKVLMDGHTLLAGGNSVGKSTVCEALELVLGPERMFRRPVVDEFDFYAARYQPVGDVRPEIRVDVVLTDLSSEAQRRFGGHLRRWSPVTHDFCDLMPDGLDQAEEGQWSLPVVFFGRYDPAEDDFEGGTFFAHPEVAPDDLTEQPEDLGAGLKTFTREDKRHCGFLYLRPNRTGNRALTFQRGSLLDTIVRLEAETTGPLWEKARTNLEAVILADEQSGFSNIRAGIRDRVDRFLNLADVTDPVDLQASELTRGHLREVLRLFIATKPGSHAVPFNRLSTGSLNLLVFALLTYIAELKGDGSVIFAMEEPEIALPPHAQRRLVDFVMRRMGQVIVTSHSPYVIEKFDPARIVIVDRDSAGKTNSKSIALPPDFKLKRYRDNRRQFAEAMLARAVLVVEGATEAAMFPAVADVLESDPSLDYLHLDLAGVTVFDAGNDVSVPWFAPAFKGLGKPVYGIHDLPKKPLPPYLAAKSADFSHYEVISYTCIEDLLVAEVPVDVQRRFLAAIADHDDYPSGCARPSPAASEPEVKTLTSNVLTARKGYGWAALLIAECRDASDLPKALADMLLRIDTDLRSSTPPTGVVDGQPGPQQPGHESAQDDAASDADED